MYEAWAKWWVRRYLWALEGRPWLDGDDLYQAAMLGVLRAQRGYSEDKGAFSTYSSFFIRREIRQAIGIRNGFLPPVLQSLDVPLGDDPEGDTLLDLLPDESAPDAADMAEYSELVRTVREAVEALDASERDVIRLHRLEGRSVPETAEALGIAPQEVRRLDKRARFKHLAMDRRLRALADLTPYDRHVGVREFNTTWTSATEKAALWRIDHFSGENAAEREDF